MARVSSNTSRRIGRHRIAEIAHPVERWCGHYETLWLSPPWDYVDAVALCLVCSVCRRAGDYGPLDREVKSTRINGRENMEG